MGHGGKVAAPMAKKIIETFVQLSKTRPAVTAAGPRAQASFMALERKERG